MKKWEHKVIGINSALEAGDDKNIEDSLNSYGEEGWELVGILDQVNSSWGVQPRVECNLILLKKKNYKCSNGGINDTFNQFVHVRHTWLSSRFQFR